MRIIIFISLLLLLAGCEPAYAAEEWPAKPPEKNKETVLRERIEAAEKTIKEAEAATKAAEEARAQALAKRGVIAFGSSPGRCIRMESPEFELSTKLHEAEKALREAKEELEKLKVSLAKDKDKTKAKEKR